MLYVSLMCLSEWPTLTILNKSFTYALSTLSRAIICGYVWITSHLSNPVARLGQRVNIIHRNPNYRYFGITRQAGTKPITSPSWINLRTNPITVVEPPMLWMVLQTEWLHLHGPMMAEVPLALAGMKTSAALLWWIWKCCIWPIHLPYTCVWRDQRGSSGLAAWPGHRKGTALAWKRTDQDRDLRPSRCWCSWILSSYPEREKKTVIRKS